MDPIFGNLGEPVGMVESIVTAELALLAIRAKFNVRCSLACAMSAGEYTEEAVYAIYDDFDMHPAYNATSELPDNDIAIPTLAILQDWCITEHGIVPLVQFDDNCGKYYYFIHTGVNKTRYCSLNNSEDRYFETYDTALIAALKQSCRLIILKS